MKLMNNLILRIFKNDYKINKMYLFKVYLKKKKILKNK